MKVMQMTARQNSILQTTLDITSQKQLRSAWQSQRSRFEAHLADVALQSRRAPVADASASILGLQRTRQLFWILASDCSLMKCCHPFRNEQHTPLYGFHFHGSCLQDCGTFWDFVRGNLHQIIERPSLSFVLLSNKSQDNFLSDLSATVMWFP